MSNNTKIKVALVGGGEGSFIIRAAHMPAIMMDNHYEVVAGAFSSNPERSKASAAHFRVDEDRAYGSWQEMLEKEIEREDGARMVVIGTPNHLHVPIAIAAWNLGYHVVTDKPMSNTLAEAEKLYYLVKNDTRKKQVFAITHNYMRNPMAVMAAEMVRNGDLGGIHYVSANYFQGWLADKLEDEGHKQASWRTNPDQAGAGAFGDIGVHAFMQAIMMSNLDPDTIMAQLNTLVEGREVDDHGFAIISTLQGARIILQASQVMQGHVNNHWIEVCGTKGSLLWRQEDPDYLELKVNGKPKSTYQRNACTMTPIAASLCRVPGGHPEAYLEGFANVYSQVANQIHCIENGLALPTDLLALAPNVGDGYSGNIFIECCQRSNETGIETEYLE